ENFHPSHVTSITFEVDGLAWRHSQQLENLGSFANFVSGQLVMGMGIEDQLGGLARMAIEPGNSFANMGGVSVDVQADVEIILGKPSGNLRRRHRQGVERDPCSQENSKFAAPGHGHS